MAPKNNPKRATKASIEWARKLNYQPGKLSLTVPVVQGKRPKRTGRITGGGF